MPNTPGLSFTNVNLTEPQPYCLTQELLGGHHLSVPGARMIPILQVQKLSLRALLQAQGWGMQVVISGDRDFASSLPLNYPASGSNLFSPRLIYF